MPTMLREKGCPATSERDLLLLTRGELDESVAEDLLLLMAKFNTLYDRWSEYASLNPDRSVLIRARVVELRTLLKTTKVDF